MKKASLFLVLLLSIGYMVVISPGCANQVPPTGGPRDSIPPMLLNVSPPDSAKNFAAKKITFSFDEYVQLAEVQQNLLVSPTPTTPPVVDSRLRTVTVTIRDTLEENTTYALDFGNSIRDINEGNVLKNFRYIFSTGTSLDSAQFSGKVILAETGGIDSSLVVMLHRNLDDSAVIKDRPRYVARVDGSGNFRFQNLAPGTYAVYALKDESGMRRYQSPAQLFAFADSPILIPSRRPELTLKAFVEDAEADQRPTRSAPKPTLTTQDKRLRFQTTLSDGQLGLLDSFSLTFPAAPLLRFDSSLATLVTDSFKVIQNYSWYMDTSRKKLTLLHPWIESTGYNLILDKEFAEDTSGRKLVRADTVTFRTRRTSEYGSVRFRFLNLDMSKNPILQFVQNNQVKFTHVFVNRDFNSNLFQPGEYDLRIVYDRNRNGKWDPGEFFRERKQPEEILPLSRKITIKANWDNETDFTL